MRGTVTLQNAVDLFLADRHLAANTRRSYEQAFNVVIADHGHDLTITKLTTAKIRRTLNRHWGNAKPATWNARITALQSFTKYCVTNGWMKTSPMSQIERQPEPRPKDKVISYQDLDQLWRRPDVDLREKLLWHMLYETAARTNEILSLNIQDLDLVRKRAVVTGKGGHLDTIHWATGTARLLPRYLGNRREGPLFVTKRQPNTIPAETDRCPTTGLGRLSYQSAHYIFKQATPGWTLHQLRHSALTHLGEAGVSTILLQAKSRHQDPRTLARYAKPSVEAVAKLTANNDRGRRHPQRNISSN